MCVFVVLLKEYGETLIDDSIHMLALYVLPPTAKPTRLLTYIVIVNGKKIKIKIEREKNK
jgi:hypothetical protein